MDGKAHSLSLLLMISPDSSLYISCDLAPLLYLTEQSAGLHHIKCLLTQGCLAQTSVHLRSSITHM